MSTTHTLLSVIEQLETASISLNLRNCVKSRNRNTSCANCADTCPSKAITISDSGPEVNAEKCTGCCACASACPSGAIIPKTPANADPYRQCRQSITAAHGAAVLACRQILEEANGLYDPDKVTNVRCIAQCDESFLLTLAAFNGATSITLVHGTCEECPCGQAFEQAQTACDTTKTILEAWANSVSVKISAKLPAATRLSGSATYNPSRRNLFAGLKDTAKQTTALAVEQTARDRLGLDNPAKPKILKVDERGVLPQRLPEKRIALLQALDKFGEPLPGTIRTHLFGSISIDIERCTSCRMCATFCPTGAIFKFSTKKGRIGIKHRVRDCIACSCCEDICMGKALTLVHEACTLDIASASVKRFEMKEPGVKKGDPYSIVNSMRQFTHCEVYER